MKPFVAESCRSHDLDHAKVALCLGCGEERLVCSKCWPTFTSCTETCRDRQRKYMKLAWKKGTGQFGSGPPSPDEILGEKDKPIKGAREPPTV